MTRRPRQRSRHRRIALKIGRYGVGAILMLGLVTHSGAPARAQSAGRNYARCIQSCNTAVPACLQECSGSEGDCAELFPGDPEGQQACEEACEQSCDDARDECRQVCENIKSPTTPEEP